MLSRLHKKGKHALKETWYFFKRSLMPYPLAFIGKYGMKLLLKSCKIEVIGLENLKNQQAEKSILMIWHSRLALMCEFFQCYLPGRKYAAFLSKSRDGEPIAHVLQKYPHSSAIRVAHNMRHQALKEAITYLNTSNGVLLITPDGPKGPRCKAKPGVVLAAKESKAPVVAFTWEASSYWEFKTWDKFRLPKPFSRIKIVLSSPIAIDSSEGVTEALARLEAIMANIEALATIPNKNP